jgi:hypothetical protein
MTQDPTDPAGDYGYDLAHDDAGSAAAPAQPPHPGPPPSAGADEDAGDYNYDEAHDFRSR